MTNTMVNMSSLPRATDKHLGQVTWSFFPILSTDFQPCHVPCPTLTPALPRNSVSSYNYLGTVVPGGQVLTIE